MPSSRPRSAALAIVLLLLTGCSAEISDCPPIATYSAEQQRQVAAELVTLPASSAIERLLDDYSVLRDQLRSCVP